MFFVPLGIWIFVQPDTEWKCNVLSKSAMDRHVRWFTHRSASMYPNNVIHLKTVACKYSPLNPIWQEDYPQMCEDVSRYVEYNRIKMISYMISRLHEWASTLHQTTGTAFLNSTGFIGQKCTPRMLSTTVRRTGKTDNKLDSGQRRVSQYTQSKKKRLTQTIYTFPSKGKIFH